MLRIFVCLFMHSYIHTKIQGYQTVTFRNKQDEIKLKTHFSFGDVLTIKLNKNNGKRLGEFV